MHPLIQMHGVIQRMPIPDAHVRRAKCKIKLIIIPARKFLFRGPRVFTRFNGRLLRLIHRYQIHSSLFPQHQALLGVFVQTEAHTQSDALRSALSPIAPDGARICSNLKQDVPPNHNRQFQDRHQLTDQVTEILWFANWSR
jgi:hypothetical protein